MIRFIKRLQNKSKPSLNLKYSFTSTEEQPSTSVLGDYVIKSKMSGNSQENLYEKYRNFYNRSIDQLNIPGTTIVRNRDQAHKVIKILKGFGNREHAWDTETVDVDAKLESPIGSGKIICASAFCGFDVDFGNGPNNFAQNTDLILLFKDYLEDSRYKKIWHNYGFDRHIFYNHGIDVKGFGGDTMHMARLADPSRGPKEYSLSSISKYYEEQIKDKKLELLNDMKKIMKQNIEQLQYILKQLQNDEIVDAISEERYKLNRFDSKEQKINFINNQINLIKMKEKPMKLFEEYYLDSNIKSNMKQLFGKKKYLKDGKEGKTIEFPNIIRMHTDPELIEKWVNYSCLDAEVTFFAFQHLKDELKSLCNNFEDMRNMLDLYNKYWKPFGEILTDMERRGFEINIEHLEKMRVKAEQDMIALEKQFMDWVCSTQEGLEQFNCSSSQQLQQLFFAPYRRRKMAKNKKTEIQLDEREQKDFMQLKNTEDQYSQYDDEMADSSYSNQFDEDLSEEDEDGNNKKSAAIKKQAAATAAAKKIDDNDDGFHSDGRKKSVRKEEDEVPQTKAFKIPNLKEIIPEGKKKPPKQLEMNITGLGLKFTEVTESGMPAADLPVLKSLAGNPKKGDYGKIGEYYIQKGDEETAKKASFAIDALIQLKQVETLLTTFIIPLRELPDKNNRIHCSLNINTETGRISARKPNLMNQPSHDKDTYKIRSAFQAGKGKKLIVADYGQLELRILAHMTDCKAMIDAFKQGGDFHSRTAMGMYPKLKEEIEKGELLLEWDRSKGEAPAPLLKDKYSSERKKAKMMNFSIAYGKSAHGFSKDWGCTLQEAQEALDAWFADRIEVKEWQRKTKETALDKAFTQTMMGRYRNLERHVQSKQTGSFQQFALRASINTPIQGGAADLVIAAMVKVSNDQRLKELGYELLLQIHDELILEGPEEHAKEALQRVIDLMENPLDSPLRLKMEVDAKIGNNWYECK